MQKNQYALEQLKFLEQSGNHAQILQICPQSYTDSQALHLRYKASRFRSESFVGNLNLDLLQSEADLLLNSIYRHTHNKENILLLEAETLMLLSLSRICRRKGEWKKAKRLAAQASKIAKTYKIKELHFDAQAARAQCLAELDSHYLSCAAYEAIRKDLEAPLFRRQMATLNESWLRFDLGQWAQLNELRDQFPRGFEWRPQLALLLLNWQTIELDEIIQMGPSMDSSPSETPILCTWLTEYALLSQKKLLPTSWLIKKLLLLVDEKSVYSDRAELSLKLLQLNQDTLCDLLKKDFSQYGWREKLAQHFLVWLSTLHAKTSRETQKLYWEKNIACILQEKSLDIPLIPNPYKKSTAISSWSKEIMKAAGIISQTQDPLVLKDNFTLIQEKDGKQVELNFERHPLSWQLLLVLSGSEGKTLSKEELHNKLTRCRYTRSLHDNRLHQLLSRLGRNLEKAGIDKPWTMRGNHTLRLNRSLLREANV